MTVYSLNWMADALRKAGCNVVEDGDWKTRGHSQFGPPKGVLCFAPDTLVLARRGLTPIKDIVVGDEVLTHKRRWRAVTATGARVAFLHCLRGQGHPGLLTTAEHPFLAYQKTRQRIEGRKVRTLEMVGARYAGDETVDDVETSAGWVEARDMAGKWWCSPAAFGDEGIPPPIITYGNEKSVILTEALMWVIGYWLGNGSATMARRNARTNLYCPLRNVAEVAERVKAAGLVASVQAGGHESVKAVCLSSKPLARWFEAHFGHLAHGKTVPPWALSMKRSWRDALLNGYLLADGGRVKPQDNRAARVDAVTVSKQVAIGIKLLAQSLGFATSLYLRSVPPTKDWGGRTSRQRPWWTIRLTATSTKQASGRFIDGLFIAPCRESEDCDAVGWVHNISVDDDESYVADGLIVHNCHHTAGAKSGNMPSLGVLRNGRPGLSGPLANLGLGRDGTFYCVAAGVAYHAGDGVWGDCYHAGNHELIGIEMENTGLTNDVPWPEKQIAASIQGVAALLKHIGRLPNMCAGHKEYALPKGRKPDPSFDMVAYRKRLTAFILDEAEPAPPTPTPAPSRTYKVAFVAPDTLNLRDAPNGKVIAQLPEGSLVELWQGIPPNLNPDADVHASWVQIHYPSPNRDASDDWIGWVWNAYLTVVSQK